MIEGRAAGENIDRGVVVLGPGVNRDVRFGDDDDAADAVGAEGVEDIRDDRPVPAADGFEQQLLSCRRRIQHRGVAAVQLEQGVAGERGLHVTRAG